MEKFISLKRPFPEILVRKVSSDTENQIFQDLGKKTKIFSTKFFKLFRIASSFEEGNEKLTSKNTKLINISVLLSLNQFYHQDFLLSPQSCFEFSSNQLFSSNSPQLRHSSAHHPRKCSLRRNLQIKSLHQCTAFHRVIFFFQTK